MKLRRNQVSLLTTIPARSMVAIKPNESEIRSNIRYEMRIELVETYKKTKLFSSCSPYKTCQEETTQRRRTTGERHADVALCPGVSTKARNKRSNVPAYPLSLPCQSTAIMTALGDSQVLFRVRGLWDFCLAIDGG